MRDGEHAAIGERLNNDVALMTRVAVILMPFSCSSNCLSVHLRQPTESSRISHFPEQRQRRCQFFNWTITAEIEMKTNKWRTLLGQPLVYPALSFSFPMKLRCSHLEATRDKRDALHSVWRSASISVSLLFCLHFLTSNWFSFATRVCVCNVKMTVWPVLCVRICWWNQQD